MGFYESFIAEFQQWAFISGTKGHLSVSDYIHPRSDHVPAFELDEVEVQVKACDCGVEHNASRAMAQHVNMVRNFSSQIASGKLNEEWPMIALKTQQVTDACLESAQNGGRPVALNC
jgi:hypothetical protein